jgi:uncharacterized membrane protein YhaH (DUF805 family)
MALVTASAVLFAVGLFALMATALGHRLLRLSSLEFEAEAEHLLCSAALGVICLEALLFLAQISGHIRAGVTTVLAVVLFFGRNNFVPVFGKVSSLVRRVLSGSPLEKFLIGLTGSVVLLEGLAAMAPVTGSDALHYHFTAPLLILRSGFQPNFFLSHSFFCGQSHLLILAGLALGSSQLSMGLLYLGGVLAALAGACLARRWTDRRWSWMVALAFLVTPVVFWQISAAGAPDLWMAFFATVGVIVISRPENLPYSFHAILAGALAGAVAGTKYTGCIVAASMAVAYFWNARSARGCFFFVLGALGAGAWPYARNLAWSGDPVFPFLTSRLSRGNVNTYALASYLADTGAGAHKSAWQILKFPFFAGIDPTHLGFWQYFGPLVLAFAPLVVLVIRNTPAWRATLIVWILSALGIGASSGMTRFLLPVLPIALAAGLAGAARLRASGAGITRYVSTATLCGVLSFGLAGLLVYDRSALAEVAGFSSRENYLRDHSPEYEKTEFINRVLSGKEAQGLALVFLRHTYNLEVPFLYGDPAASWAVDPSRLQTPQDWQAFLHAQAIHWIVRSPDYPPAIAAPLCQMEAEGQLVPIARSEVSDFRGLRILGDRQSLPIVVLEVKE